VPFAFFCQDGLHVLTAFPLLLKFHMLYLILVIVKNQSWFRHLLAWTFGFKNTFIFNDIEQSFGVHA